MSGEEDPPERELMPGVYITDFRRKKTDAKEIEDDDDGSKQQVGEIAPRDASRARRAARRSRWPDFGAPEQARDMTR